MSGSERRLILVGNPNVGKSLLFNALSPSYAEVSNYAGTTLDCSRGAYIEDPSFLVIDTPGCYSLRGPSDEERATREILSALAEGDLLLNVLAAGSLVRDLFLTSALIEAGLKPALIIINQIDECEKQGLTLDLVALSKSLGLPVIAVSALTGAHIVELKSKLSELILAKTTPRTVPTGTRLATVKELRSEADRHFRASQKTSNASNTSEQASEQWLSDLLIHPVWGVLIAGLFFAMVLYQFLGVWIAGDLVNLLEKSILEPLWTNNLRAFFAGFLPVSLVWDCGGNPAALAPFALHFPAGLNAASPEMLTNLQALQSNPACSQNYLFSAADGLGMKLAAGSLLPALTWATGLITVLLGQYGVLTITVTYLLGVLMPLVFFFYLSWSLLEDSGYLPRLALLADRFMVSLGLNGRGVIPLTIGFGCVTMAMVTTRMLPTRREQTIAMILLAFAIPCSAVLGIIQGLLVRLGGLEGWLIWCGIIVATLLITGNIAQALIPGKAAPLFIELPRLRWPNPNNVLRKSTHRTWFFLLESGVAFFWAALVVALFQVTGLLGGIIEAFNPLIVGLLHLPESVSVSFLLGMIRRDFGAFGLLDLPLSKVQAVVAATTLTLFLPCIATLAVMIRERGWGLSLGIWFGSWVLGFGVGGILTRILEYFSF